MVRKPQAGGSQFKAGCECVEGNNLKSQKSGPSLGGGGCRTRESSTPAFGCCWPGWS